MITKYDPKIYPLKLYVAVGDDQRENVKKKFSTDFDINQDLFSDCDAMTLMVRERKTRHLGVLIWLSRDGLGIRAVCHESSHFVCNLFDYCGISMGYENGQDEHFAYLLGWCVECVMDSVAKYLKKNKHEN